MVQHKKSCSKKAAYVESFSNHPIAVSVVNKYNKEIDQSLITDVEEISGHGVKASLIKMISLQSGMLD